MTKRKIELRPRSYADLMQDAGDRMNADAIRALREYQAIRAAGGTPEILWSPAHGWVIKAL